MSIVNMPYSNKGRSEHDRIFNKTDAWEEANVKHGVQCPYEADGKAPWRKKNYKGKMTLVTCFIPISDSYCLCSKYPCPHVDVIQKR